jgi:hypothetical protein
MEGVFAPLSRRDSNFNDIFLLSGDGCLVRRRALLAGCGESSFATQEAMP